MNFTDNLHTVPNPTVTGNNVTADVDATASLACTVTSSVPDGATVSYQWTRGNANLSNALSMYQIPSVSTSDAGVYTCEVTVEASSSYVIPSTKSVDITLTVNGEYIATIESMNASLY